MNIKQYPLYYTLLLLRLRGGLAIKYFACLCCVLLGLTNIFAQEENPVFIDSAFIELMQRGKIQELPGILFFKNTGDEKRQSDQCLAEKHQRGQNKQEISHDPAHSYCHWLDTVIALSAIAAAESMAGPVFSLPPPIPKIGTTG